MHNIKTLTGVSCRLRLLFPIVRLCKLQLKELNGRGRLSGFSEVTDSPFHPSVFFLSVVSLVFRAPSPAMKRAR